MTGYEEILTDPSYSGQIVTFTFPHIGNVGVNEQDIETLNAAADGGVRGVVLHAAITAPSNHRAQTPLGQWLKSRDIIGIGGIDTRALTALIRDRGMPNAVIAHDPDGRFDLARAQGQAAAWHGIEGTDLVPDVTSAQRSDWDETVWSLDDGLRPAGGAQAPRRRHRLRGQAQHPAAARRRGLRRHGRAGHSQRRGDPGAEARRRVPVERPRRPAETARYAVPVIREIVDRKVPTFGICLGHQLLALSLGAKTVKMHQGHHGANHPVKDRERAGSRSCR